jgi:hypothetical protein
MSYSIFILQQEKNAIISDLTNVCLAIENENLPPSLSQALRAEIQNYERQIQDIEIAIVNLSL